MHESPASFVVLAAAAFFQTAAGPAAVPARLAWAKQRALSAAAGVAVPSDIRHKEALLNIPSILDPFINCVYYLTPSAIIFSYLLTCAMCCAGGSCALPDSSRASSCACSWN
jgi:hypothetical protein